MPNKGAFKKGDKRPRKPKGAENKVTKEARELFKDIMEGEIIHVQESFQKVRQKNPAKYLDCLSKLMPYFLPKQVDLTSKGNALSPMIIDWTGNKDTADTKAN